MLTLLALGTAAGLAAIAVGLARARPWSRIPAVMTQVFVVIAGISLLDGHRPEWGVPALGGRGGLRGRTADPGQPAGPEPSLRRRR